jgi:hypothetical protein
VLRRRTPAFILCSVVDVTSYGRAGVKTPLSLSLLCTVQLHVLFGDGEFATIRTTKRLFTVAFVSGWVLGSPFDD